MDKVSVKIRRVSKSTVFVKEARKRDGRVYRVSHASVPVKHKTRLLWFRLPVHSRYPAWIVVAAPTSVDLRGDELVGSRDAVREILGVLDEVGVLSEFTDARPEDYEEERVYVIADPWIGGKHVLHVKGALMIGEPYRVDDIEYVVDLAEDNDVYIPDGAVKRELPENYNEVMGCEESEAYMTDTEATVLCRERDEYGLGMWFAHYYRKLKHG